MNDGGDFAPSAPKSLGGQGVRIESVSSQGNAKIRAQIPPTRTDDPPEGPDADYSRFERLTKRLLRVPKEEIKRQEKQEKRAKAR